MYMNYEKDMAFFPVCLNHFDRNVEYIQDFMHTTRIAFMGFYYRKTSNISRTLLGNKIVDNSNEVGASPVGAAPTTSSFST